MKYIGIVIGAIALLATSVAGPTAAATGTGNMQERVEAVLAENPGGTQIGWNEISWDDGDVILTLAPSASPSGVTAFAAVGGCTAGRFCAYSQSSYGGDKITFSTCTSSHSVSALSGPVRSMANSRTSGTIRAYAGSTLLASAAAGTGSNVTGTTTKISCT